MAQSTSPTAIRALWLRRDSRPNSTGSWRYLALPSIGNAAARETLVTATSQMAGLWSDLFQSLLALTPDLRWRGSGLGIGRDAQSAYSNLLGRYMARAYLTECERVRVLVPLDVAKGCLEGTGYSIGKQPQSQGHEADWIGLDDQGLVICEAKGTSESSYMPWRGPRHSWPQPLQTAIGQARRTIVFADYHRRVLPARRWAIATRWGVEHTWLDPTLLAWHDDEDALLQRDYRALARLLPKADLQQMMSAMSISDAEGVSADIQPADTPPDIYRFLGLQDPDLRFAAAIGPFGVHSLRSERDRSRVSDYIEGNMGFAVVLLSARYIASTLQGDTVEEERRSVDGRGATRHGLTVIWSNIPATREDPSIEQR